MSCLYAFLRDEGSIIAGLLALVAGGIAYAGAMRAARIQVDELRQQNSELKAENRRTLARDGIIAVRLLSGVVNRIKDDTKKLRELLEQPQYKGPNVSAPGDWRKLIRKPPLEVVWNNLGVCGREIIDGYLLLDSKIDEFAEHEIAGADYMSERVAAFDNLVGFLNDELDGEAQRCLAVLAEGV
jgi:hypothetical protein